MNKYIDIIISQNPTQFYAQFVQYISLSPTYSKYNGLQYPNTIKKASIKMNEISSSKIHTLSLGYHTR